MTRHLNTTLSRYYAHAAPPTARVVLWGKRAGDVQYGSRPDLYREAYRDELRRIAARMSANMARLTVALKFEALHFENAMRAVKAATEKTSADFAKLAETARHATERERLRHARGF